MGDHFVTLALLSKEPIKGDTAFQLIRPGFGATDITSDLCLFTSFSFLIKGYLTALFPRICIVPVRFTHIPIIR